MKNMKKIENIDALYVAEAGKPGKKCYYKAIKMLNMDKSEVVMIGDQIFTDVLGANMGRMKSILLEPQSEEHGFSIYVRRKLEVGVRKKIKVLERGEKYVSK